MKENYIKRVKSELVVSKKQKKEVVRDLNEAFASALEHGETEQQVMERLGNPKDFANNIHEQLGTNRLVKQQRKKRVFIRITSMVSFLSFSLSILLHARKGPQNIIGQADAMTSIKIEGSAIDPTIFFMSLGVAALVVGIFLTIRYIRNK